MRLEPLAPGTPIAQCRTGEGEAASRRTGRRRIRCARPALRITRLAIAGAILLCSHAGWSADASKYREFAEPRLKQGRAVWLGTCEACHAHDLAGAPLVSDKKAWAPRLAKGSQALYAAALGGLTGPKGTQMPPRGGNSKLSDDEVKAAVDYMAALVK